MNIVKEWNCIDSLIMKTEHFLHDFRITDLSEQPDVETMIQAETEQLRAETERLKARETPIYLIENKGRFLCPKCQAPVHGADAKYCSNCGHRVIRHIPVGFMKG